MLRVHHDGSLSLVRHGVVSSGGTLPDSVAVSGDLVYVANSGAGDANYTGSGSASTDDGQFLFTVNTASGTISRFQIAANGTLTLLGSTTVGKSGGVGAVDTRLSPDGSFLYVDESKAGAVGVFAVNGGNLTELASSPAALPAGATPADIVVN